MYVFLERFPSSTYTISPADTKLLLEIRRVLYGNWSILSIYKLPHGCLIVLDSLIVLFSYTYVCSVIRDSMYLDIWITIIPSMSSEVGSFIVFTSFRNTLRIRIPEQVRSVFNVKS